MFQTTTRVQVVDENSDFTTKCVVTAPSQRERHGVRVPLKAADYCEDTSMLQTGGRIILRSISQVGCCCLSFASGGHELHQEEHFARKNSSTGRRQDHKSSKMLWESTPPVSSLWVRLQAKPSLQRAEHSSQLTISFIFQSQLARLQQRCPRCTLSKPVGGGKWCTRDKRRTQPGQRLYVTSRWVRNKRPGRGICLVEAFVCQDTDMVEAVSVFRRKSW